MSKPYDPAGLRRPVNVTVNAELLLEARRLGVNISRALEVGLLDEVRRRRAEAWVEENEQAIDAYNRRVDGEGVFSDGLRSF